MRPALFFALIALAASLSLVACGSNESNKDSDPDDPPDANQGEPDAGPTNGDDASQPNPDPDPIDPADLVQLPECFVPANWTTSAFDEGSTYTVDLSEESSISYEFAASDTLEEDYHQQLWIELYPTQADANLTGTFDLADENFTYATCERCVLIAAGAPSAIKYYLAESGMLTLTEVTNQRISGTLTSVTLVEVTIHEDTFATARVADGCTTHVAKLDFSYVPPELDPHVETCFIEESLAPDTFDDLIVGLDTYDGNYFYQAMRVPDPSSGLPHLQLFIEVYEDGLGSFDLSGAETNCPTCMHFAIIEATMPSGATKTYVSDTGRLVLTALSSTLMEGRLEDVRLVETIINESTSVFTPVSGGCTTEIPSLDFSSADADIL